MKKIIILLVINCCQLSQCIHAQRANKVGDTKRKYTPTYDGMYLVDSLIINEPILVKFEDKDHLIQYVLLAKNELKSKDSMPSNYHEFFLSKGYMLFPTYKFSCLLNNYLGFSSADTNYKHLRKYTTEKKSLWLQEGKQSIQKQMNGWEYEEITANKFLLFLVKGDFMRYCQSRDEIQYHNMENIYFKVLIPMW